MKNLRKEKGISQKKMAERLNLIPSAYSNYENLICEIPVEVMQKFCEEVECSMEELIEFDIGNLDEVHPVSSLSDLILSIMELNKKDLPVSVTFHMEEKKMWIFEQQRRSLKKSWMNWRVNLENTRRKKLIKINSDRMCDRFWMEKLTTKITT